MNNQKSQGTTTQDDEGLGGMRCSPSSRVSVEELRRHWEECLRGTESLVRSDESFNGFIVGFRMYERMITKLGRQMTDDESRRFVAKK
jgi:hypothetical protein